MAGQPAVVIYARVSTGDQTVENQLRDLREYAGNRGWSNVREFHDVCSGSKDSRPAWNDVWAQIKRRQIDILLVHGLDRIGRSLSHLVTILTTLTELDIALLSFRESIDLRSPQGRLLAGLFALLAEFELSLIRERTCSGMRNAKAKGKQIGNRMRYFDVDEATQLRDAGWGQIKIARKLGIGVGRINAWCRDEYLPPDKREHLANLVVAQEIH